MLGIFTDHSSLWAGMWIRIRFKILFGSGSALKIMRIHIPDCVRQVENEIFSGTDLTIVSIDLDPDQLTNKIERENTVPVLRIRSKKYFYM